MFKLPVTENEITERLDGTRDIDGLYHDINELLKLRWPGWKGQFTVEYPTNADIEKTGIEVIVPVILQERPMNLDTSHGRSGTPMTKTPSRGFISPRICNTLPAMGCGVDDEEESQDKNCGSVVYQQVFDIDLRFKVFARTNREKRELAKNFRQFIRDTRPIYIKRGLCQFAWQFYNEDNEMYDRQGEVLRYAAIDYFVRYEMKWTEKARMLETIHLKTYIQPPDELSMDGVKMQSSLINMVSVHTDSKSKKLINTER